MMTKKDIHDHLNEQLSDHNLGYLTVVCSTRTKKIANKCRKLLASGNRLEALRIGDPTAYNLLIQEVKY
jgi:hypothetical protein